MFIRIPGRRCRIRGGVSNFCVRADQLMSLHMFCRNGPRAQGGGGRAIVRADDTIETYSADIAFWMDDSGLLGNQSQAQAWAGRHFDMHDMSWQPFTWKPKGG